MWFVDYFPTLTPSGKALRFLRDGLANNETQITESKFMDILSKLKEPLVMSMFSSRDELYQEGELQRAEAAKEIERMRGLGVNRKSAQPYTPETGTLAELNVKAGDVVEASEVWTIESVDGDRSFRGVSKRWPLGIFLCKVSRFKIISRATPKPRTWAELTDAEKGALLLADLYGDVIQWWSGGMWHDLESDRIAWGDQSAYRIKPEPVRETVDVTANGATIGTIETLDGIPQPDTIKLTAV